MNNYETPSYEVEYFSIKNDILTTTSENPDQEITGLYDEGYEVF